MLIFQLENEINGVAEKEQGFLMKKSWTIPWKQEFLRKFKEFKKTEKNSKICRQKSLKFSIITKYKKINHPSYR